MRRWLRKSAAVAGKANNCDKNAGSHRDKIVLEVDDRDNISTAVDFIY